MITKAFSIALDISAEVKISVTSLTADRLFPKLLFENGTTVVNAPLQGFILESVSHHKNIQS